MKSDLEERVIDLVREANVSLKDDVLTLLKRAEKSEKNKRVKQALNVILENAAIAKRKNIAICQDTGLPLVFLEIGRDLKFDQRVIKKIKRGVTRGYKKWGFRASSTIPFKGGNAYNPDIVYTEFTQKKGLRVTIFPKGFGAENKSKLKMFSPTATYEEIDDFVVKAVKDAGAEACPPFFVGVGIGGTADFALVLAKKALLEELDKPNPDKFLNSWEERLYKKINKLEIGAMGWGGRFTCLKIRIKTYATHLAGLPVGVNISCHALRRASLVLKASEV